MNQAQEFRVDVALEFERQWRERGSFSPVRAASVLGLSYRDVYRTLGDLKKLGALQLSETEWLPGPRASFFFGPRRAEASELPAWEFARGNLSRHPD